MDSLLYDCCSSLLETTVDALDDPPELRVVTVGDPTNFLSECPYVAVTIAPQGLFQSINVAARGQSLPARPTTKTALQQAVFEITIISDTCYPAQTEDGGDPSGDDINAHSLIVMTDMMDAWTALRDEAQAGTLLSDELVNGNNGCSVDPPSTLWGAAGMVAGCKIKVYADLLRLQPSS